MTLAPADADRLLLEAPSDIGIRNTDRKCTLQAPEKLLDHTDLPEGTYVDETFPDEFDLAANQRRIRKRADELIAYDAPLLTLGGDHSITAPLLQACREQYPDLRIAWIDAHYDLKAIRIDDGVPHDAVLRSAVEDGFSIDDIAFFGVREQDDDEAAFLQHHEAIEYGVEAMAELSQSELGDRIEQQFGDAPVYLSFDIDVLDPDHVPGTTFPSPGGLAPGAAQELVRAFDGCDVVAADLVEVAEPLDDGGRTVTNAVSILDELLRLL